MKKQEIINFWIKLWIPKNHILKVLEQITGLDKNQLFLSDDINDKLINKIENYFSRLVSWEPIEYVLKKAEFYGYDFYVDSRVLIPRNDTEVMVEKVVESLKLKVKSDKNIILIDVWTWSSCIPISVLKNLLTEEFNFLKKTYAIDISKDALEVARINIKKHNLENKIELVQWDLLEKFWQTQRSASTKNIVVMNQCVHPNIIITANLPYIKNWDFENMDEETINFEPDLALYWWEKTGFELYKKLIYQIFELQSIYNIESLVLFIEIGFDQKQIAIEFLEKQNLKFEIFKDNGWIERCVKIYF